MAAQMPPQYTPSAEKPLMEGMRAKLVRALDENVSLFEIMLMMEDVVEDLSQVQGVSIANTLDSFKEGAPMMQMVSLLHYVNRKLLRSIVAGTLAYDLFQDPDLGANCQYNDNSSAGTYVVSLSIQGRQGKFLNIGELRRLAGLVERYAGAVQTWILNRQTWNMQDPSDVMKRNFIMKVDNMASRADAGGIPLFGTNRAAVEKCEELVKMFRRRAVTSLDIQNQGQTYQIQAPMMVGCTGETIAKRTKSHYPQMTAVNPLVPAASSLTLTTKTWGLTVSLLYYMGMKPEIVHVAALPFMYSADLPRTEILLTTLARSFVWQDGFNIIQGGGKSDSHSSDRGKAEEKNVCYARDFLKSNLSATLQRMQEIRNKIAIIKNLSQVNLDALEAEVTKLQAKESELELEVMQLNKVEAEFMKGHERMKEIEKEQDKQIQLWTAWNGLLDFKEKEGSF
ncbi:hypothetical protein SLS64_013243 [Diaporthe eres]|uniref:Uncharacterized protein n=1 Tax=Diaporthe eres TaxID=83184 RepID=A0ABR1P1A6_DIAER